MQIIQEGGADALQLPNAMKFDVALEPMETKSGIVIPNDMRMAVVNTTNKITLGTCGKHYRPKPYHETNKLVHDGLVKSDLNLSKIIVKHNLYDNGAVYHMDVEFPLIEKSLANVDDIVTLKLDFWSSLNLTKKLAVFFRSLRMWCKNEQVTNHHSTGGSKKHTIGLDTSWLFNHPIEALVNFEKDKQLFDRMLATSVSDDDVAIFFKETIAKLKTPSGNSIDGFCYHSKNVLTNLMNRYKKEVSLCKGRTLFAVYNTMTNYSTHVNNQEWTGTEVDKNGKVVKSDLGGKVYSTKYDRQLKVARSLNHPLFKMAA